jgi:RNA polymerase sigma-70 factor (ECF subfamily)
VVAPAEPLAQLQAVYREHHPFVWRSLQRLGVPEATVPDAVHDVFLVVARRLHEFEHRASMRTWLFAIAYRVAQGVFRDRQRQARREEPLADPDAQPASESGLGCERSIALQQLLGRLDEEKRAVFILAYLEGMTAPEIAAALDLKVPTVYSRLRLAREAMERAASEPIASSRRLAR